MDDEMSAHYHKQGEMLITASRWSRLDDMPELQKLLYQAGESILLLAEELDETQYLMGLEGEDFYEDDQRRTEK